VSVHAATAVTRRRLARTERTTSITTAAIEPVCGHRSSIV
jgi:hypothetical protein